MPIVLAGGVSHRKRASPADFYSVPSIRHTADRRGEIGHGARNGGRRSRAPRAACPNTSCHSVSQPGRRGGWGEYVPSTRTPYLVPMECEPPGELTGRLHLHRFKPALSPALPPELTGTKRRLHHRFFQYKYSYSILSSCSIHKLESSLHLHSSLQSFHTLSSLLSHLPFTKKKPEYS